jgi:carboxypeptidase T
MNQLSFRARRLIVAGALVLANVGLAAAATRANQGGPGAVFLPAVSSGETPAYQLQLLHVFVNSPADANALASSGFDVLEARGSNYLIVMGDADVAGKLRAQGYRVEVAQTLAPTGPIGGGLARGEAIDTYYGGYRTVAEHFAHLDAVVAAYPNLATQYTYGSSLQNRDLRVICITNKQAGDCALSPTAPKPRFLLMAAIHARELSTAETAYRWIDHLTQNYATNADVKMLLDTYEMWVIPLVNPDGRVIVEAGGNAPYTQRKNVRDTGACSYPPTSSSQDGVDLNRNAATANWGGAGTSTAGCNLTYRGASPASEPEQAALQTLAGQLFADTKGPNRNDPAAANTTGVFITLHSYSNLVLLPYGDALAAGYAPNDAGLRNLAFRMSFYNNYITGTGDEILYVTTGTTDDWVYGTLGVPGFTFEIGPETGTCSGFTPAYSCQDGTFWPLNLPALMYAAKTVAAPYAVPAGPTSGNVALSAASVAPGANTTLSANMNDNALGPTNAGVPKPTAQVVSQAEYYIDTPPWAGGTPVAMSASDGSFNGTSENVSAVINTTGLSVGQHTVYVRGRDASGNWGTVSAIFLNITNNPPGNTGLLSPSANAAVTSGSGDNNGYQTSAANAYANDGAFAVDTNSGNGTSTSCTSTNKDRHVYSNYNVSIPGGQNVTGITVRLDARADSTNGSPRMCVQLSWDGGVTWTAAQTTANLTTSEATYNLGGANNLWGRPAWSATELSNANLRVRVVNVASSTQRDFSLDWIAIQVNYQ